MDPRKKQTLNIGPPEKKIDHKYRTRLSKDEDSAIRVAVPHFTITWERVGEGEGEWGWRVHTWCLVQIRRGQFWSSLGLFFSFGPIWDCFSLYSLSFRSSEIYLWVCYTCFVCKYWYIWENVIFNILYLIIFSQMNLSSRELILIEKDLSKLLVRLHSVCWISYAA